MLFENDPDYKLLYSSIETLSEALGMLADTLCAQPAVTFIKGRYYSIPPGFHPVCCSLESIEHCIALGHIADAYTLVRKVRDDLLQYIFMLATAKEADNDSEPLNDSASIEQFDENSSISYFETPEYR